MEDYEFDSQKQRNIDSYKNREIEQVFNSIFSKKIKSEISNKLLIPVIIKPDPVDEDGEGDDDEPDPLDEDEKNLIWLWITFGISVIGAGIYGFFRPKKMVDQFQSRKKDYTGENLNSQSVDALEKRRMRVRTNRNRRNN
jgi:hypothetical protein